MKVLSVLSVLLLVALTSAVPSDRGCQYILGKCDHECPEGTHGYAASFSKPWHWEPTCATPNPELQTIPLADYSACYCDPPTVRDTTTDTCVTLDKCPKIE